MTPPRIIISCGDINGIGLRCLALAIQQRHVDADLTLAIEPATLRACIDVYALPGMMTEQAWIINTQTIAIDALSAGAPVTPGQPSDLASRMAIASLDRAIGMVRDGSADAILTLPVNKHALAHVGWPFPGQTEMIAAGVGGSPLMVLCSSSTRVALATVHVPLRDVVSRLSVSLIAQHISLLDAHLRNDIGIASPRIAVLAVNPHAGDHGVIGSEDDTIVGPAIALSRDSGIDAYGPFPADGFFAFGDHERYDGILAMYHDQGLIPLKLLAKGAGCNVTAGLRVIRTSPDHGTAYGLALHGTVDTASTLEAIDVALRIVHQRSRTS